MKFANGRIIQWGTVSKAYPTKDQPMPIIWSYSTPFSANPIVFVEFNSIGSVHQMGAVEATDELSALAYYINTAVDGQTVTAYFFAIGR